MIYTIVYDIHYTIGLGLKVMPLLQMFLCAEYNSHYFAKSTNIDGGEES